jgi:hypothetical protein
MRYQLRNVRINRGVNSRGQYEWLQAQLFNDAQPWANPNRLPQLVSMTPEYIELFKEEADANLKEIPEYAVKQGDKVVLQVFELTGLPKVETVAKKLQVLDPSLTEEEALKNAKETLSNAIGHISHVHTVVQPIKDGKWQPVYRRDTVVNGVNYPRGAVRVNNNGEPVPAITSMRVTVRQYFDPDTNTWQDVENPEDIANLLLERGYKRVAERPAEPIINNAGAGETKSGEEALSDAEKEELLKRKEELEKLLNK